MSKVIRSYSFPKRSKLIIPFVIVLAASIILYSLYRPRPILADGEHGTILRVQVSADGMLHDFIDYDEDEILYLLSRSYERRTLERARPFSLDDVKVSVVLSTEAGLKQVLLGAINYSYEGYHALKYDIIDAQALEAGLLEILLAA